MPLMGASVDLSQLKNKSVKLKDRLIDQKIEITQIETQRNKKSMVVER